MKTLIHVNVPLQYIGLSEINMRVCGWHRSYPMSLIIGMFFIFTKSVRNDDLVLIMVILDNVNTITYLKLVTQVNAIKAVLNGFEQSWWLDTTLYKNIPLHFCKLLENRSRIRPVNRKPHTSINYFDMTLNECFTFYSYTYYYFSVRLNVDHVRDSGVDGEMAEIRRLSNHGVSTKGTDFDMDRC